MTISVNHIPSVNVPLTDKEGRISPIWHEFLRSFVAASVDGTVSDASDAGSVTAGAGLTGGGTGDITLAVGTGSGIVVNADDVGVDIAGQSSVQAVLDDEVMIADISDNNAIRKTKIRNIVELSSPGGVDTQIQYNDGGVFGGDSGFTTTGAGSIDITGDLSVDNINLNGNTIITTDTNGDLNITPNGTGEINIVNHVSLGNDVHFYWAGGSPTTYGIGGEGGTPYMQGQSSSYKVLTLNDGFRIGFGTGRTIEFKDAEPGIKISGDVGFYRTVSATITASTTQTQGQQPLVRDINEVSICANVNDTVTLPTAIAGGNCLVINNGAQTLQVFPASGDNLGAGLNTATTIVAGSRKLFIAYDTTNWEPVI